MKIKLQFCLVCSVPWGVNSGLLCGYCESVLWKQQNQLGHSNITQRYKIPVHSLYKWVPKKGFLMNQLVRSFKNKNKEDAAKYYFEKLRLHIEPHSIIVPCPPKNVGELDHAYGFAKAFSEIHQLENQE